MIRVVVLLVLVVVAGAGCKKKLEDYGQPGTRCSGSYQCADICNSSTKVCAPRGVGGEACGEANDCLYDCISGRCDTAAGQQARHTAAAVAAVQAKAAAELAKNQELLKASGIEPTAEILVAAGDPASRIRLATTTAKPPAFAACLPGERLVGGGCRSSGGGAITASYPSAASADDTVGGRWNCAGQGDEITSTAMCVTLPPK